MRSRRFGIAALGLVVAALLLTLPGERVFARGDAAGMLQRRQPATAPYDQRWLDEMIMHHQQGVMMTQHLIADSQRAELRDLAKRIITTQQREIDQMRAWRTTWYGTSTGPGSMMGGDMMNNSRMMGGTTMRQGDMMNSGSMMGGTTMRQGGMMGGGMMGGTTMRQGGMMGGGMMVGMDRDRHFLEMMISHHESAIAMAEEALSNATHAEITTLAQTIIATQRAEIVEMRGYLKTWYGIGS